MASISNSPAPNGSANMQPKAEKDQNSGYLGVGSEGQVAVTGKIGFNGVTPVGKASNPGSAATGASISLLDVLTVKSPINDHATKIDALTECLKKAGLMS